MVTGVSQGITDPESLEGIRGWVTDSLHPHFPALSPKPRRHPSFVSPELLSPPLAAQEWTLVPSEDTGPGTPWGQTHLVACLSSGQCSALEKSPHKRLALSPEQTPPPCDPPEGSPDCPGLGCRAGFSPRPGLPYHSHLTEAEQGHEGASHGMSSLWVLPWGRPWIPQTEDRHTGSGAQTLFLLVTPWGCHISSPIGRETPALQEPGSGFKVGAAQRPGAFLRSPFQVRGPGPVLHSSASPMCSLTLSPSISTSL